MPLTVLSHEKGCGAAAGRGAGSDDVEIRWEDVFGFECNFSKLLSISMHAAIVEIALEQLTTAWSTAPTIHNQ